MAQSGLQADINVLALPETTGRSAVAARLLGIGRLARKKPLGTVSLLLLVGIWAVCLLAPAIAPYRYDTMFTAPRLLAPTSSHLFGTDESGRDVLSRVLYGGRVTLTLSLGATALGTALAVVIGTISGYVLGTFDLIFQRVTDALQALPALIVLLVIGALFYGNRIIVLCAVAVLFAPGGGRLFRSAVLKIRSEPYVEAAATIGASHFRIITRHVLPNIAPLIIVVATVYIGANVLLLASLSFLGVINAEYPDWGTMLNVSAARYMVAAPWLVIAPGAAITLVVLAYNLLGDALRDILDPRLRRT